MLDTISTASAAVDAIGLPVVSDDVQEDLIQSVRARAGELRDLLQRIELQIDDQHLHAKACEDIGEMQRLTDADPYRWHADARRSLQAGIMYLERAVVQPTTF